MTRPKPGLPDGAALPDRARAIWRMRPDLQRAFDLTTTEGQRGLFWWYFLNGFKEMGLVVDPVADHVQAVNAPFATLPARQFLPITWLMRQLWVQNFGSPPAPLARSLVRRAWRIARGARSRLADAQEQKRLLDWYFTRGLTVNNLEDFLTPKQAKALLQDDPDHPGLSRLHRMIWHAEPSLSHRFAGPGDPAFRHWCETADAGTEWPILSHPLIGIAPPPPAHRAEQFRPDLPFGVNLIGHARGRFGIGEDLRMAALALTSADIPFVIHNIEPTSGIKPEDQSVDDLLSKDLPYAINVICMSAWETVNATLERKRSWYERYNIGIWHWELSEWPDLWNHAYNHIDELWAPSEFTFAAYKNLATIPVLHQPVCVSVGETQCHGRSDFGLPDGPFLFAFSFDGYSTFARKNPVACLQAFRAAFPRGDEPVGLIIKAMRIEDNPAWRSLSAEISLDPRIRIVTQSLPREELLDFYRSIDCFISLHRSEGFGRNIAECMALGKPVIVTAYSGNMDFTTAETAALVPVSLRPLRDDDYPFGAGQHWAEPDVEAASALMRRMIEEPEWRDRIATNGRALIAARYNPTTVGRTWAAALERAFAKYRSSAPSP